MICTLSKHEAEAQGFTGFLMLDFEGKYCRGYWCKYFF